jgi:hypothetical protein
VEFIKLSGSSSAAIAYKWYLFHES